MIIPDSPPASTDPQNAVQIPPTRLWLDDGTGVQGRGFGAAKLVRGEVVFNTAMVGYVEALTDPSYCGQILVLTYPLVGNYGVPPPRRPGSLDGPYESDRIQVQGLVVQNCVDSYSHHAASRSLHQWLLAEGVPGLTGVDTRFLTRQLRAHGTMQGWLGPSSTNADDAQAHAGAVEMRDEVFRRVAPREPVRYGDGKRTVLLVDAGAKDNIVRSLYDAQRDLGELYGDNAASFFLPKDPFSHLTPDGYRRYGQVIGRTIRPLLAGALQP